MGGMRSYERNIVALPRRRGPVNLFKFAGRVAMALALALAIIFGPSQISVAAPDVNSAAQQVQHQHDEQASAGHNSTGPAESRHHTAAIKVYCNAATPGHADHAQHGDDMCEGSRVMSSALTSGGFDIGRYYIVLGTEIGSGKLPAGHSPERLKEPPRTA